MKTQKTENAVGKTNHEMNPKPLSNEEEQLELFPQLIISQPVHNKVGKLKVGKTNNGVPNEGIHSGYVKEVKNTTNDAFQILFGLDDPKFKNWILATKCGKDLTPGTNAHKIVVSILGREFTRDEETNGFDPKTLTRLPCQLILQHKTIAEVKAIITAQNSRK